MEGWQSAQLHEAATHNSAFLGTPPVIWLGLKFMLDRITKFASVHLCVLAGIGFLCCPSSAQGKARSNWTVMVYMNGRDGLDCAALHSFEDIASTPSTPEVRILIELARPSKPVACLGESSAPWGGMLRFEIRSGSSPTPNGRHPVHADMGSRRALNEFLSWARRTAPSNHYILIIWGHGTGPAFLNINPTYDGTDAPCAGDDTGSSVKAVSSDQESGHILYNRDVENALRRFSEKTSRKIDIVGFDACLMATLETAYAMKDVAHFLVASEEVVPDCSWDYASALAKLISANGHLGAERLSKLFVEGYEAKYTKYPSKSVQNPTLAAVNLEGIQLAAKSASALARDLEAMLGSQSKNAVVSVRNQSHFYGSLHNLIDLVNFLRILQDEPQVPAAVAIRAREVESTITAAIYQYAHDPRTSNGLSIYFPQNRRRYEGDGLDKEAYDTSRCSNRDKNHAVDFVCDTFWPIFIRTYLNSVGEGSDEPGTAIVQRDQKPK
jgi:hypothetical protein